MRSQIKLVIILVLFIAMCFVAYWLSKNNIAEKGATVFNSGAASLAQSSAGDTNTNNELRQLICGLWQKDEPEARPGQPYKIYDHIEIKPNGIFWQVKIITLVLPNQDTVKCMHVLSGLISPFAYKNNDSTTVIVDAFVRAQAFAMPRDTCYISNVEKSMLDQQQLMTMTREAFASIIQRKDSTLTIDGKCYTSYDTNTHALADFFPLNSVNLVDKLSINECRSAISFSYFVRDELSRYFSTAQSITADTSLIRSTIKNYYEPLIVTELSGKYTMEVLKPLKGKLQVSLSVSGDGSVESATIKKGHVRNRYFEKNLVDEIKTWRFARDKNAGTPHHIVYDFVF